MAFLPFTKKFIKDFFSEFSSNKISKLSAALAYYTVFSLPALLLIVMRVSDIFYGDQAVEGKVYYELANLIGKEGAQQIQQAIRYTAQSTGGRLAAIAGIVTLILGASGIFTEIQDSINQIWHLKTKPSKGKGFLKMIINRLLSFSMIAVLGFLLLVSLIVNSLMDILVQKFLLRLPQIQVIIVYVFNFAISFFITAFLLAVIFKVLPDARIKWRDVRPGVIATTILFMLGKFLISFYLGKSRVSSSYGAAGSVIITLVWIYYSSIILFVGAIFTRLYALHTGSTIYPNSYAVWIEKKEIASRQKLSASQSEK